MTRILFIACAVFFSATSFAYAQSERTGLERDLDLSLSPARPTPGQTVQLSIKTFAIDLLRSNVVWYANDREIARGPDVTEASVVAGPLGSETRIFVTAEDEEGTVAIAEAVIRPTEIDLLWEADSYVPPFYAGRVMPGTNSPIRLQALTRFKTTDGKTLADSDIIYTWYRNTTIAAEGRGKSTVILPGPQLFDMETLRVVAVSADRTLSGEASVTLSGRDPPIMLYENHPLFGILYHRSLEPGATTMEIEQKVSAVPYFARINSPSDAGLAYEWSVNGSRIEPNPREPQTLTIAAGGYSGPVDIGLELTSMSDVLMRSTGAWQLIFGEQSSFFGGLNPFGGN